MPAKLTGGEDLEARDYNCVPLARRVDLDRVHATLLEFPPLVQDVAASGEGSSTYKREPRSHMNPYHSSCQIKLPGPAGLPSFSKTPARVKIGVTDYWQPNMNSEISSTGAKLYAQAKPEWSMPALRMVCSVLEEADIEIPPVGRSSAPRLFTSPEGRPWGRPRVDSASSRQRWEAQLGITAASVSAAAKGEVEMAPDKVRGLLDRIAMLTATEPFSSNLCRFAQGLALHLSAILTHRLGEEWDARAAAIADWSAPGGPADATGAGSADSKTEAGVSAASGAAATGAGVSAAVADSLAHVPPPAPGESPS